MNVPERLKSSDTWLGVTRYGLALGLLVWLAFLLADTVWLVWKGPSAPIPEDPSLETVSVSGERSETLLTHNQVRDWALFGAYEPVARKDTQSGPVDAPETRLRLELLGVFQTGDSASAGAIIAEKNGEGQLYRPGEVLPGNATLEEVYGDRVILRRQGRLETLKLKEPELAGGGVRQQTREAGAQQRQPAVRSASNAGGRSGASGGTGLRGDVERQRKQIISGLGLQQADGGYRISGDAPDNVIGQVGLQPGDIIVSVNGHQVGNKEADLAALREYHQSGSATIVVQRGAQRFTVTVPP